MKTSSSETKMEFQVVKNIAIGCRLLSMSVQGDARCNLISIDATAGLPFQIARVYYIFGTSEQVDRGFHAHRNLVQWAICVSGACTIILDDGQERTKVRLDTPDQVLEIGSMVWREMRDFTEGAVLLVLANSPYDEADYIRDYDQFLAAASHA